MSLELRGLQVDLGGTRIVEDVSLTVPDGTFAGLLGPNGSGKSTILRAVYRSVVPVGGSVWLGGDDVAGLSARQLAQRLAVVTQETVVEFDMTVTEMVLLGRIPHQSAFARTTDNDRDVVADALRTVGCADLADRSYHTLSGGEKQRVLVARALSQEVDHLILDEPTNHLDIRYQMEILDFVAGLGVTVLAALHDLSLASLYCDELHLLSNGRLCASGTPAEVVTAERVRDVYGADVLVIDHPETGLPQLMPRRPTLG